MFSEPCYLIKSLRECSPGHHPRVVAESLSTSFVHNTLHHPTYETISAYARLGHKYQMDSLVQQASDYLRKHFPTTVDAWHSSPSYWPKGFQHEHAIGVVNLARLTGEHSLLPTALLACMRLGSAVLHGFPREDGSREILAPADFACCIDARPRVVEAHATAVLRILGSPISQGCVSRGACAVVLRAALEGMGMLAERAGREVMAGVVR